MVDFVHRARRDALPEPDPATQAVPVETTEDRGLDERLAALKDATIMMVDDEETTLDVLEMFLEEEGYRKFVPTTESTSAVDRMTRERPDVVLLDLIMPGVGGLEILGAVRARDDLRHTPIIILTSATDSETKLKALELGATDFLAKPVDPSELALRLRNTLAAKAYQDRLVYYDGLTGLPNRRLFNERMDHELARARKDGKECAVLHIGLDRFKQINDSLGREVGDQMLTLCAERLEGCVRTAGFAGKVSDDRRNSPLSRIGGDEFALCLWGVGSLGRAARAARRLLAEMSEAFEVGYRDLFLTASIGIAQFPEDGEDVETLLRKADMAMSHAKQSGRNTYQFYREALNSQLSERLNLENQLRRAVEREELVLYYQPKVNAGTGEVVGAEALMRWEHSEMGFVPPDKFIPVAEDAGLITALGDWALRTACRQNKAWQDAGLPPVRIAVNVSSRQFQEGVVEKVRSALEDSGLAPEHLVLELTESMIMENPEDAVRMLREIRDLGVKLSVDDFGTGYSSLAYLKSFPLAELKIDRSFISGIADDPDDAAIVTAIVAMSHSLGLRVVAEGIETEDQLTYLQERGCDECQGFYFSPPVPPDQWESLLAAGARLPVLEKPED